MSLIPSSSVGQLIKAAQNQRKRLIEDGEQHQELEEDQEMCLAIRKVWKRLIDVDLQTILSPCISITCHQFSVSFVKAVNVVGVIGKLFVGDTTTVIARPLQLGVFQISLPSTNISVCYGAVARLLVTSNNGIHVKTRTNTSQCLLTVQTLSVPKTAMYYVCTFQC